MNEVGIEVSAGHASGSHIDRKLTALRSESSELLCGQLRRMQTG